MTKITLEQELRELWEAVVKTAHKQKFRKEDAMLETAIALLHPETECFVTGDFDSRHVCIDDVCVYSHKLNDFEFDDSDGFYDIKTLGDLKKWIESE